MADQPKDYGAIGRSILLKKAAGGKPTGVPDIPIFRGYQSQNFPINQKQTRPEQNINDLMKLPPDWDYKNPEQLGPRNETLPEGAIGWTPHATPYYGPGLEGWWKGTVSRLNSPISYESDTIIPQAEPGEELGWWQKALGTIENLGAQFYNAGGEEGGQPSPLTYVTRGVSEIVKSGLTLAATPSLGFERTQGAREAIEQEFEDVELAAPLKPVVEFMSRTSPIGWVYKVSQMLGTGKLTKDETLDMIGEGWNAGRVFYSSMADPTVEDEYKRRYQEGEDPVLLGMELENPMAELAGQLVLDPLNLLGLGFRRLKDTRKIGSVADDYFRVAPEIDNLLRGAGEADEITAVGKIQELTQAVTRSFDDLKNDYRISALTADGKRYVVSRKTNELAEWTVRTNSGNDPDRAMEIIEGVIRLSSDEADEVATGISMIRGAAVEPSPYFSRAGQEMSVTLRNLVVDDAGKINPQKFLDDLADAASKGVKVGDETLKGVDGVAYHISRKMDDTIEKMFPTITERLKAGEELPFALRALGRFDSAAQKSVYRPINTFFAGIYMGLSPGYAMRNFFTNTLHVLVDQGPGALRYKPSTHIGIMKKWLGGQLPDVAGFSAGTQGVETIKGISRKLPFSKLSERFEEWGAVQVVSKSVQDTMRKMLRPGRALPDVTPLVNSGMDPQSANLLLGLVVDNYGDVGKATAQFKKMVSGGNIDAFRTLTWMGEDSRAALYGFSAGDEVLEALKGATSRDDAISRVNAIFDDVFADGARTADEMPVASEMAEGVDLIDDLSTAVAEGVDIPQNLIENATSSIEANSQAMNSVIKSSRNLWNSASSRALDNPEKLRELNVFRNKYPDLFDEVLKTRGEDIHAINRKSAVGWKNTFKTQGKDASLATLRQWWDEIGIPGDAPTDLTLDRLWSDMWGEWYFPKTRKHWQSVRDTQFEVFENVIAEMNEILPFTDEMTQLLDEPRRMQDLALWWDEHLISDSMQFAITRAMNKKDNAQVARIYANWVGIPSVSETGAKLDDTLVLNVINNNITEGRYATLADVPPEVSQKAFMTHATKNVAAEVGDTADMNLLQKALNDPLNFTDEEEQLFLAALQEQDPALQKEWGQAYFSRKAEGRIEDITEFPGAADEIAKQAAQDKAFKKIEDADDALAVATKKVMDRLQDVPKPASPYAGNTPTMARAIEQSTDGLRGLQDEILRGINDNWGKVVPQGWSNDLDKAFGAWERGATKGVAKARLIATDVANAARDFTMLSYPQKKYFDLALAYIYPYHFWYNRTYSNWLKRIATSPEVIAGYSKYKNTLAKIHAGAPDWWKYNINSNELLGMDSENPIFFNLESTINPLNGLTGVDFNDNKKRVNWWTSTLDDMNKFGPSTWTPYSIATAAMLYAQGEEEAASRWGGRLIPQTAAIKNLTSVMNVGPPGGVELDPNVLFFSGGLDPYERRRVGRALYGLQEDGLVDEATAIDAAYLQEGDAWGMAHDKASSSRALGQLTSFLFGTGFKARSASDMQIDIFDAEYFNLWAMEDNLSPEEFRQSMDELRNDYPFMDAVLLSRKAGIARDRGLVYNVLGRIPPGQKDDIAKEAGLDYDFINKFYEDKGHIEDWEETDQQRLMAWAVDVAAILDMPDSATKEEWKTVSGRYTKMTDKMQDYFGEDIEDEIQIFFAKRRIDEDDAYAYLDANPHVEQAMSWKDATMINDALMGQYYMSLNKIEGYYKGVMWDAIEHEFGKDIWDIQEGYFEAKLLGKKQAKQYLKQFPQLVEKWDTQDKYEEETAERIIGVEEMLRADIHPFIRAGAEARSIAQENILAALQQPEQSPYQLGWEDFRAEMSPHLQSLVEDTVLYGEDLSSQAMDQLEYLAGDFGMDMTTMMQLIQRSMLPEQQTQAAIPYTEAGQTTPSEETIEIGGKQYQIVRTEVKDGKEIVTIDMDGVEVTIGDEIEDTSDDIYEAYVEGNKLYDYRNDNRLTAKTKDLLDRNVMMFTAQQLPGWWRNVFGGPPLEGQEGGGFQFMLPETIRRSQEAGFPTYGVAVGASEEELNLHELAHSIDAMEGEGDLRISDNPDFQEDAQRYMREHEPEYPETNNIEWFAMLFARSVTGSREVPSYIKKWFKPYIK